MSVVNARGGGFNESSNLCSADVARELGVAATGLQATLVSLEKLNIIRRDFAGGHGNRMVITPLSPDHWRLSDGSRFEYDGGDLVGRRSENRLKKSSSVGGEFENTYNKTSNKAGKIELFEVEWRPLFGHLQDFIVADTRLPPSYGPKMVNALVLISEFTDQVGFRCSLNIKEIALRMNSHASNLGPIFRELEKIGVIKLSKEGRNVVITPTLPKNK